VEVTFDIDANGILNVTARDKATGKEQKVTITASTNLDKKDIERMVEQANANKGEDQRRKELVQARNNADAITYQAEKMVRDLGEKVNAQDKDRIEELVKSVKESAQTENTAEIKRRIDELQQVISTIGAQAYQQPGSNGGSGEAGGQKPPEGDGGDVVEGEFKSV
jgi:molecular chaperone DnaK